MKIRKTYKDKECWFDVNEDDVIEYAENRGYYKKGTSLKILKDIGSIQTPWAIWKLITKNK
ncbi:MAG: hypothetical protein Unbinned5607contig1000_15 [Prokaryotic dsDNA virus sp.]|nr:MAG: hypothetical protein Unbinned5607contig1000_15 [Prokaryotic dsDNA virus sp.]|tara:strand:+ start:873 stop:1055 length:183 start_codon:yes stop_codon:yes gene_type:complete